FGRARFRKGAATFSLGSNVSDRCSPGSEGSPAAACSLSAPTGLSRSRQIFQLTLSHTCCRSTSLALKTALVSRQTSTAPLPASIEDDAGRVLPTKWLHLDRPCSRSTCITSLRASVGTCSTTPSSSLKSALSVSSSRRALTCEALFLASPY